MVVLVLKHRYEWITIYAVVIAIIIFVAWSLIYG